MQKNTIGAFIAALRKANGFTQQEIADRLNVSNKAVSRWERDECAPDITLIPALAELLGVSCDELLRGERIDRSPAEEKTDQKTQKQIKTLINRSISSFITLMWISIALSTVGLIVMLGVTYGFYRAVIGFAVMLLFIVAAFVCAVIAINRMKAVKTDNELYEYADVTQTERFCTTLGKYSFAAFFIMLATIAYSLPLLFVALGSQIVTTVVRPEAYFMIFVIPVTLILATVYIKAKAPFIRRITDAPVTVESIPRKKKVFLMNLFQLCALSLIALSFIFLPYLINVGNNLYLSDVIGVIGLGLSAAVIIIFIIFEIISKDDRKEITFFGIRNLLLIFPALLFSGFHSTGLSYSPISDKFEKHDIWDPEYLLYSVYVAALIFLVFELIIKSKNKKRST